jgi:hypothetical protein
MAITMARLLEVLGRLDLSTVVIGIGLYVLVTAVVLAVGVRVLLSLPPTYFADGRSGARAGRLAARIARNVLGGALVVVGAVLSLPGMPGQGVLTILVGLSMVEFPGRHRLEQALVRQRGVLGALNRVRTRFGREPFEPPRAVARP